MHLSLESMKKAHKLHVSSEEVRLSNQGKKKSKLFSLDSKIIPLTARATFTKSF